PMPPRSRTPLRLVLVTLALLAAPPLAGQDSAAVATTPATAAPTTSAPAAVVAAESAAANQKAAAAQRDTPLVISHKDAEFPQPLKLALLLAALFGMLGAFAGDLVADEFSIASVRRNRQGWNLGFVGRLVVGAVAALVTVNVNPPEGWATLVGTALVAGVAGEAILKSIAAGRRLGVEQTRREIAEEDAKENKGAAKDAMARARGLENSLHTIAGVQSVGGVRIPIDPHASARESATFGGATGGAPPAPSAADIAEYARRALDEVREQELRQQELRQQARPSER
ncbi:MAG TPA: DUF4257 domain-containing protein, partial [Longimicrobium sp.]|nr:DUF4257 domain-containing protein [Longimicrobium sp.]